MKKQPDITAATKQKFIDTFWEIASEKGFDKVTIRELTSRAHYHRSTFYEYYSDIHEMIEEIEMQTLTDLAERTKITPSSLDNPQELRTLSLELISTFTEHGDYFLLLAGKHGDPLFLVKARKLLLTTILPLIEQSTFKPYAEYIAAYLSSSAIGLLSYWYENGKQISAEELGEILYQISFHGIPGIIHTDK